MTDTPFNAILFFHIIPGHLRFPSPLYAQETLVRHQLSGTAGRWQGKRSRRSAGHAQWPARLGCREARLGLMRGEGREEFLGEAC